MACRTQDQKTQTPLGTKYGLPMSQTHNDSHTSSAPAHIGHASQETTQPAHATADGTQSTSEAQPVSQSLIGRQIDALSLTQALLDFEMANARVLDLTARLVEANARVIKLQTANDALHAEQVATCANLRAQVDTAFEQAAAANAREQSAVAVQTQAQADAAHARAELAATHATRTFRFARTLNRVLGRVR